MSHQRKTKIITYIIFILANFFTITVANAAGIKNNHQELTIKVDARGCVSSVELASQDDNCAGSDFANNCGNNGKDCVCMQSSKFVSWMIDADTRFELKFIGDMPFKPNCEVKSGNNKKIQCKIDAPDGDYEYDVIAESCPDEVYDPKIIIRTSN